MDDKNAKRPEEAALRAVLSKFGEVKAMHLKERHGTVELESAAAGRGGALEEDLVAVLRHDLEVEVVDLRLLLVAHVCCCDATAEPRSGAGVQAA